MNRNFYTADGKFISQNKKNVEPFLGIFGLQKIKDCQTTISNKDTEWLNKITETMNTKDTECVNKMAELSINKNTECDTKMNELSKTKQDELKNKDDEIKNIIKQKDDELRKKDEEIKSVKQLLLTSENLTKAYNLIKEQNENIIKLTETFNNTVTELKTNFDNRIAELKTSQEKELNNYRLMIDSTTLAELKTNYEQELINFKNYYDSFKKSLERENNTLIKNINDLNERNKTNYYKLLDQYQEITNNIKKLEK
jgi:hypothetical protein